MALITQEQALQWLSPYLPNLHDALQGAWIKWQQELQPKFQSTRRTRASAVHDLIVENVRRTVPEAKEHVVQGLSVFVFENDVAIRFKKLDDELSPSNIATHQVAQFRQQEEIDGLPAQYHLEVGYVLDSLQTKIVSTHLICPSGPKSHSWAMDLGEYVSSQRIVGSTGLVLPFPSEANATEAKPVKFRRKRTDAEQPDNEQSHKP